MTSMHNSWIRNEWNLSDVIDDNIWDQSIIFRLCITPLNTNILQSKLTIHHCRSGQFGMAKYRAGLESLTIWSILHCHI